MKKLFVLSIMIGVTVSSFAQSVARHQSGVFTSKAIVNAGDNPMFRTTGIGSVDTLKNIADTATTVIFLAGSNGTDSGFVAGMDEYEDRGYAERYDFNNADSSLEVIGMIYLFGGVVNPASTKTASFKVWSVGAQTAIDPVNLPNYYYSGLPNTVLTSGSVPFTHLGIGTTADTTKILIFGTPTASLATSFFVGCELTYTWASAAGDTVSLYQSLDGDRTTTDSYISGTDTVVNDVSVSEYSDNTWHDNYYENFGYFNDFVLYALVRVNAPLGVHGITNKNFTFYGNYPNPAIASMNIKFSLKNATDVTIDVMDITGRTINTIKQSNLSAGEHITNLETAKMATGDYVYVIYTANGGGGIASKFTVIK